MENKRFQTPKTSWENVGVWYQTLVGEEGHYYHRKIIMPGVVKLLNIDSQKAAHILDLACGQGIAARYLPPELSYTGVDASPSLIKFAKQQPSNRRTFMVGDATKELPLAKRAFSHALVILALQNIEEPKHVLANAAKHLQQQGSLLLVLNHPCFRIPRQSSWGIDDSKQLQYRRIDRYLSPLKIPVHMEPSKKGQSAVTWSFHHPLSSFFQWLSETGFVIEAVEEWASDKVSTGKMAKIENRARKEIPLFMAIKARLHST